jgi:hypothetical protein
MPGPRSAPNGQRSLTNRRSNRDGTSEKMVRTGKTDKQRKKGKIGAAKNRPLRDD